MSLHNTFKPLPLLLAIATGLGTQAVSAQSKPIQKDEEALEKLIITSNPLNRSILESATPATILSGEELSSKVAPTLGETLKNVPGVNSTYFGPVSSSPIIRGLDGPRIKVLQNGLDSSDASRIGPDHVVSTEAANATQIEVLRGPATLLYGSGAIGGVVNVIDNRLPTVNRDEVEGSISYLHDTVSSEDTFNASFDGGKEAFIWHLDGFSRKTDDYDIPGYADIDGEGEKGTLENSFIDAQGYSLGLGWADKDSHYAISIGNLKSDYGIPGHGHGEEHGDEEVDHEQLDEPVLFGRLNQDRYQLLGDWLNLSGMLQEVHFRTAYTDYAHSEIEDGMVGTTFTNESLESRLWATHKPLNNWNGVVGLNYLDSDFAALGEEAFTPPSNTRTWAIFMLEELQQDNLLWQLGARIERVKISPENSFFEAIDSQFETKSYTPGSISAGVVWTVDENQSLAFNYAHSGRAPSAAEMFSNGLHIATSTYELGAVFDLVADGDEYDIEVSNNEVKKEISNNLDLTYHYSGQQVEASFSVFYNQIADYIYQQNTGLTSQQLHLTEHAVDEQVDEDHAHSAEALPVFIFKQQDATLIGFEAELDWHFTKNWRLASFADMTKATLDDDSYVPRIPALRVGGQVHWESDDWHIEGGFTHYADQNKIAEFETPTDGYTLYNAQINYYISTNNADVVVYLKGNNLTDEDARVHSSFIKDTAPLPGRSFVLGTRVNF